ncbi:MAG: trypsin-like peptidase domain-containing protein, partial [Ktedonobacteraceae bacterium]
MMDHPMSLRVLVKLCTVRLLVQGIGKGTGFFVAPGLVLTCAHVVAEAVESQLPVTVHTWDGQQVGQTFVETTDVFLKEISIPAAEGGATHAHKYP